MSILDKFLENSKGEYMEELFGSAPKKLDKQLDSSLRDLSNIKDIITRLSTIERFSPRDLKDLQHLSDNIEKIEDIAARMHSELEELGIK